MKKFIIHNLLFIILFTAFILRIWRLDVNLPALSPDEAALGYNAYSILMTGKDEYGEFLPFIFKSFGDYKPGLYVYLTVPFVAVFGLNEWSVRLPSAVSGVISVYVLYLIVKQLLISKFQKDEENEYTKYVPIAVSGILAISPWHILFSRGAWEINVSLMFTLLGILFFLKSLIRTKYIIYSSFFFSLTLITYQGSKLSTLIVIAVLFVTFFKEIINLVKDNIKITILSLVLAAIISSPVFLSFYKGQTGRLQVFSIFSYPRPKEYLEKMLIQNNEKIGDVNYLLYHNETLNFVRGILGRYFNHFSGRYLFFSGDYQNPKHSSPNHGVLLMFDIFLLPLGVVSLFRQNGRLKYFIFLWLFLSPLPAVLTRDQVQAVRSYNMLIPLSVISAFGLMEIFKWINKLSGRSRNISLLISGISFTLFLASFIYFLDSFFVHLPVHNAKYWNFGYKQVITKLLPIQNNYETVYFQQSYDQPYIYYLFYSKYDPEKYQKQANLSYYLGHDVGLVERLDNITFLGWSWPYATGEKSTLLIGNGVAIPADLNLRDYNLISEIKYPDNFMTSFRMVETK